jgi:lipopolysaccharide export LptBFGC system permease protein LptF
MSVYEMNQQIVSQLPDLTSDQKKEFKKKLEDWVGAQPNSRFFLLYGKDIGYFTLFERSSSTQEKIADIFMECFDNIGPIKTYDITSSAIEVWANSTVFYFFNYDNGVEKFNG